MANLDAVRAAFDAGLFRDQGHALIDQLADYLGQATAGGALPVLPWVEPSDQLERWPGRFPEHAAGGFAELVTEVLAASHHIHHPRYIGHQVTAPAPLLALTELVGALLNNSMAVYEMGPASTAMERRVIAWMAAQVGFAEGADGVLTSGGSVGNLTALLAARQARAGYDVWARGTHEQPLAVLVSEQAHYSVRRAAAIMGLGEEGVVPVPTDARFKLRPEALPDAYERARRAGRLPVAVVASAGSTATGALDPLEAVADFCAARGLWLHVDGAHGAALALSPRHRPLLAGIERADSVVWDAHKMMLTPGLVTAVLFREGARSYEPFAQEASYLFGGGRPEDEWFNYAHRTLECTKRMKSLELYTALSVLGTRFFGDYVAGMVDLAAELAALLRAAPDFELALEPECNIVCFRNLRPGLAGERLDRLQEAVRRALVSEGGFYIVQTRLPAGVFLRATVMNPLTTASDLSALLDAIRRVALTVA
jgi:L-2,4-diaminobutyrate decarboxylase